MSDKVKADDEEAEHSIHHGRDIGWFNISAYNMGVMGYSTANIDRIARESTLFTDFLWTAELCRRSRCVHHRQCSIRN